jgi:GT2 family glycosyltransferase/2-polyprenyl-3-methyl-5-hydroxy-6-metoxy-1,4-benzoquinol methylase/glycosyltransferase involved in cell wall biosynthesis
MKALVEQAGYVLDAEQKIWLDPNYGGIAYSDGDEVEQRIGRAIREVADVSVLSTELRQYCIDWPSVYHLSGTRANLMRPFEPMLRGADVLEIGAGCGAITRFLGESGAQVLALEGSPRRAAIARSRTRDLDNVTVLSEKFDQFKCVHQFDVITLIGVLEYANMFTGGDNPTLTMLSRVRTLLKPGGQLIVAIENQLGLKYFAGAPEDHLGRPMIGIEGRYRDDQPHTFGRQVLTDLLKQAGFAAAEFLAPFPDYKLPVSIVTEPGFADPQFDAAALAWQSALRDPQLPAECNFSLELAFPQLIANGLGMDVANSFLIAASPTPRASVAGDTLAFHYSVDRIPAYCKETRFVHAADGQVQVLYRRLGGADAVASSPSEVRFVVPAQDEYATGKVFTLRFIDIISQEGWSFAQIAKFLQDYLGILAQVGAYTAEVPLLVQTKVPGRFFDVIPQNIVIASDGQPKLIDKEWQLEFPIEIGHLLFRSLLALIKSVSRFARPSPQIDMSRRQFIDGVLAAAGLVLDETDYVRYNALEAGIQQTITGRPAALFMDWGMDKLLPMRTPSDMAAERAEEVIHLRWAIGQRDATISERDVSLADSDLIIREQAATLLARETALAERDADIAALRQQAAELEEQLHLLRQQAAELEEQLHPLRQRLGQQEATLLSIVSSGSWNITKPYRWVGRVVRGDFSAAMVPLRRLLGTQKVQATTEVDTTAEAPVVASAVQTDNAVVVPQPVAPTHSVSVILPVYRGIEMTRRCIEAAMPGVLALDQAKLLAINDGSPDAGMQAMLEELAEVWPGRFDVLQNLKNLGFVGTVNRGLAHFSAQDVVLLNSDVMVPHDWLARLVDEAYARPDIATVTPFSNNATICSFPNFLEENPQAFDLDVNAIDAVFRRSKLPCVAAPTGIGFCMYIRRACLDQIGYLDTEKFGRGYGEENDLCQRALKAGWLNVLSPNLYAYHEGGVSFSTDKQALVDRAMGVLDKLHPNYHADVQRFIQADPLRLARIERYIALLAELKIPKVLHVTHASGGGVAQHVEELANYLGKDIAHLLLSPHDGQASVSVSLRLSAAADKLRFVIPLDYENLLALMRKIGVSAVHFHHTYSLDTSLLELPVDLGITSVLTVHDYYWLNANPTLTNADGRFLGKYDSSQENPLYPLPTGMNVIDWQNRLRKFIESADCVIFPCNAVRDLFGDIYELNRVVIVPHVEKDLNVHRPVLDFHKKNHYVIGVLGAVGREKGADVLESLAEIASSLSASVTFKLIGYAYRPLKLVEKTGPYKVAELPALIDQQNIDVILFPAQWPETYSYTLSHALNSGLPIIAPGIGAFPERLSGRSNTMIFNHLEPHADLFLKMTTFIEALPDGKQIAPIMGNISLDEKFYAENYSQLVGKIWATEGGDNEKKFRLGAGDVIDESTASAGWRHALLKIIWRAYMSPSMRWVDKVVPYKVRRGVKRALSRRPMHDIFH